MGIPALNAWSIVLAALPNFARARVEQAVGADPPSFLEFVMAALESGAPPAKPGPVASVLLESGVVAAAISNPSLLPLEDALRLARAAMQLDSGLDYKILATLTSSHRVWPKDVPTLEIMRVLEVVDGISDCRRLAMPLMKFVSLPDRRVRSKAVKLLARASSNAVWADSILHDTDPRVRSNLVEGIAQHLGKKAAVLLRKAAEDPHHRVAVTSLLALSRLGDLTSREALEKMAVEGSELHRNAAAWALRQLAATPSTSTPHPIA